MSMYTTALLLRLVLTDTANDLSELLGLIGVWKRPLLREIEFRGLLIDEGWMLDSKRVAIPVAVTGLFAAVIAARLVYGDWDVAWNVGCFLVGLASLLCMWVDHAVA